MYGLGPVPTHDSQGPTFWSYWSTVPRDGGGVSPGFGNSGPVPRVSCPRTHPVETWSTGRSDRSLLSGPRHFPTSTEGSVSSETLLALRTRRLSLSRSRVFSLVTHTVRLRQIPLFHPLSHTTLHGCHPHSRRLPNPPHTLSHGTPRPPRVLPTSQH